MYSRESVLNFINEVIENEGGGPEATEESLITELGLDSFGITVLYLELDEKYGKLTPDTKGTEAPKSIISHFKVGELIDRVQEITCT